MALMKDFVDQYGNTANYIKINSDSIQDHTSKTGCLKVSIWKDTAARNSSKQQIAEIEIAVQEQQARLDNDGCVKTLQYIDCADKTRAEIYALLKTKKIKVGKETVDLSNAEDC